MESKVVDEIWPDGVEGAKYGALVVTISAILFYYTSRIFVHVVPAVARHSHWRWKNITVSFIHSLLSGLWACYWYVVFSMFCMANVFLFCTAFIFFI